MVDMFLIQYERYKLHYSVLNLNSAVFSKNSTDKVVKKMETPFEL